MQISNAIAQSIVAAAHWEGVDPAEVYRAARIDPTAVEDAAALMSVGDFGRLVDAAVQLSGEPALGMRVAEAAPLGMLHVIGHLVASSDSLRAAFAAFQRYASLVDQTGRHYLMDVGERAMFGYEPEGTAHVVARVEIALGYAWRMAQLLLATTGPVDEVWLAYPAPSYAAAYERLFGCPVRFAQAHNALVFPAHYLDHPLLSADPATADAMRARADALLASRDRVDTVATRAHRMLMYEPSLRRVTADQLARRLHMSARTLRRRMAAEGRSFSEVLDQVRRERATAALLVPATEIKRLADELGFSEPSALYRAFRRWTGTSIAGYRRR